MNVPNIFKSVLFSFFCALAFFSCTLPGPPGMPQKDASLSVPDTEERFMIDDKTGIVFDKTTGLEWYSGDISSLDELGTRYWMNKLNTEDPGWRLPTRNELYTLKKATQKCCRILGLNRDEFWIKNFRVYDLFSNIVFNPRMRWFRHSLFFSTADNDDPDNETRAYLIVVRHKNEPPASD